MGYRPRTKRRQHPTLETVVDDERDVSGTPPLLKFSTIPLLRLIRMETILPLEIIAQEFLTPE